MRIVHLTDLHFHEPPGLRQVLGKRAIGLANLALRGRARQFGGESRDALVADVRSQQPDLVVITGDLTALATPAEFQQAHDALQPVLEALPTVLLAGNHDRYTLGSFRTRRMERTFGRWMEGGTWDDGASAWVHDDVVMQPARFDHGDVTVLTLDTARPDLYHRGRLDPDHLARLETLLASGELAGRFVVVALHYPLLDRDGSVYDRPKHRLVDSEPVIDLLRCQPVQVVLHGHVHHWFTTSLPAHGGASIPVLNGGSSGLAPGGDRDPGYLVLQTEGVTLASVNRRTWDGGGYVDRPVEP